MATVESLEYVVRGDAKEYVAALRASVEATRASAGAIGGQWKELERSTAALKGQVDALGASLGGLLSAAGIGGFREMIDSFAQAEATQARLAASIAAAGRDVAGTVGEYKAFAAEMAEVTTTGRGATMGLLAQASALGLVGTEAERAVRNSVALAAISPGMSPQRALRLAVGLEEGRAEGLQRLLPQIRNVHGETQKAAAAQKALADAFGQAEAQASTLQGQQQQLANDLGVLRYSLGEAGSQLAGPVVSGLRGAVKWLGELEPGVKTTAAVVAGSVAGWAALAGAVGLGTSALTALGGSLVSAGQAMKALSLATFTTGWGALALSMGAVVAATALVSRQMSEGNHALQDFNRAAEKTQRLRAEALESDAGEAGRTLEKAAGIGDIGERREFVKAELYKAQLEQARAWQAMQRGRRDVEALDEGLRPRADKEWKAAVEGLKLYTDMFDTAEKRVRKLKMALLDLLDPSESHRLQGDLGKLGQHLQEQIDLFGAEGAHRKVAEMRRRGASEEQLEPERQRADALDVMKEWAHLEKALESLDDELKVQINTWDRSASEVRLYKLELMGASEGELAARRAVMGRAEALREARAAQEEAAKTLGDLAEQLTVFDKTAGEKAYHSLYGATGNEGAANQARNLTAQLEAMKTAADLATPSEKLDTRMRSLNEQYLKGGLSAEVYARAVEAARRSVVGMGNAIEAMDIRGADFLALLTEQGRASVVNLPARRAPWKGGEAPGAMPGAGGAYALPEAPGAFGDFANPYGAPGGDKVAELLRNILDELKRQGKVPELRVLGVDLLG